MAEDEARFWQKLGWLHSRRLDRLQTAVVLPTARSLYLAGSIICVAAFVLALAAALYFQLSSWKTAGQKPVPDVIAPPAAAPDFGRINQRLSGPTGLRFVVETAPGTSLSGGRPIGHFDADAGNGLASFPNDFQIVGGRDADLFDAVYDGSSGRTGLTARAKLAVAYDPAKGAAARRFIIRVLAHDAAGNSSSPADVAFVLNSTPSVLPAPQQEAAVTELGGSGPLPKIARAIALIASPGGGTPEYFDAYKTALAEPERCGADPSSAFIPFYRNGFIRFRRRLTTGNLNSFYLGLCESWKDALEASSQAAAASASERERAIADNAAARVSADMHNAAARMFRNGALGFAFTALISFMMITLFLAFLALEGHSAAVRRAVEVLAAQREDGNGRAA